MCMCKILMCYDLLKKLKHTLLLISTITEMGWFLTGDVLLDEFLTGLHFVRGGF